jgi:hypothetical protein
VLLLLLLPRTFSGSKKIFLRGPDLIAHSGSIRQVSSSNVLFSPSAHVAPGMRCSERGEAEQVKQTTAAGTLGLQQRPVPDSCCTAVCMCISRFAQHCFKVQSTHCAFTAICRTCAAVLCSCTCLFTMAVHDQLLRCMMQQHNQLSPAARCHHLF